MIKSSDTKIFGIEHLQPLIFNLYSVKNLDDLDSINSYIKENIKLFNSLKNKKIFIIININFMIHKFYLFLLQLLNLLKYNNINFNNLIIIFDESAESRDFIFFNKIKRKINEIKEIFNFKYFILTSNYYFYRSNDSEVIYFPYFFYYLHAHGFNFKNKKSIDIFNLFFKYKKLKKTYLFNSLNRRIRSHRIAFLYYLKKINFNNDYLLSFDKIPNNPFIMSSLKYDFFINYDDLSKIELPIELDIKDFTINQSHHIGPFYMNTFFSQINETLYDSENIFLSEKVFKPIIRLSPFIIFGNPYTLKELERWGFETNFVGINNSYDNEKNHLKRLQMILNEIKSLDLPKKDLLDFYYQNRDVLIHNYDRKFNLNKKDILEKTDFKKIMDFYESI
jgi:hypothetical protein